MVSRIFSRCLLRSRSPDGPDQKYVKAAYAVGIVYRQQARKRSRFNAGNPWYSPEHDLCREEFKRRFYDPPGAQTKFHRLGNVGLCF